MLTKYVNLSLAPGSGNGSLGNPWSLDNWVSYLGADRGDDITSIVKGTGTYNAPTQDGLRIFSNERNFYIESWEDSPARLKINVTAAGGTATGITCGDSLICSLKRVILEINATAGGPGSTIVAGIIVSSNHSGTATYENSAFVVKSSGVGLFYMGIYYVTHAAIGSPIINIKGNDFGNFASGTIGGEFLRIKADNAAPCVVNFDSNCCEGKAESIVKSIPDSADITVNLRDSAIYSDSLFTEFVLEEISDFETIINLTDNLNNSGLTSLFPNFSNGITMTLPTDLNSVGALIDDGNPSLGLTKDLVNRDRIYDPNPDIGAMDHGGEPPPPPPGGVSLTIKNPAEIATDRAIFNFLKEFKNRPVFYVDNHGQPHLSVVI